MGPFITGFTMNRGHFLAPGFHGLVELRDCLGSPERRALWESSQATQPHLEDGSVYRQSRPTFLRPSRTEFITPPTLADALLLGGVYGRGAGPSPRAVAARLSPPLRPLFDWALSLEREREKELVGARR